jgi:hypothetical protein
MSMAKKKTLGPQEWTSLTEDQGKAVTELVELMTVPRAAVLRMLVQEALEARKKAPECTVCGNCEHDHWGYKHEFTREAQTVVLPVEANATYSVVFGGFQQPVTDPETIEVLTQGVCLFHGRFYAAHDFTYGPECRRCGAQDQEVTPGT